MESNVTHGRLRIRRRWVGAPAAIAVVAMGLAACGSSGGGGGSTGGGGSPAADVSAAGCVAQATKATAAHVAAKSQDWYPATTPKGALAKGKNLWVIPLTTSIPTLSDYANGFKNAGNVIGAKVTVFDGKGTPTGIAQGINNAVAAHAAAIVTVLLDTKSVVSAVNNAKAAHIPIIAADSGISEAPFPDGVKAVSAQDEPALGAWQVDAALKKTGCKLNALLVTTPGNAAADATYGGFKAELKKLCPKACTTTDVGIQAQDVATKTTSAVENALRLHPNVNAILEVADPYQPYVASALKSLNKTTPVFTSSSMGDLVGTGKSTTVAGDVVYPPGLAHGWFYMTAVLRLLSGEKNPAQIYPIGLIDSSNRDANDPSSYSGTSPYAGYQDQFKKLWGVTS